MVKTMLVILVVLDTFVFLWPINTPKCGGPYDPFNPCHVVGR